MRSSFQEQMLKLGLIDKKTTNQIKREKYREKTQKGGTGKKALSLAEENALLVQKAAEEKKKRDRQLNREREKKLQKRAELAKAKQLIEQHKLPKGENGKPFRFNVSGKIHRILVEAETAEQLSRGGLGIVEMVGVAGQFEIVPKEIVAKIRSIDEQRFTWLVDNVSLERANTTDEENDPYAEYKIPDDLMW